MLIVLVIDSLHFGLQAGTMRHFELVMGSLDKRGPADVSDVRLFGRGYRIKQPEIRAEFPGKRGIGKPLTQELHLRPMCVSSLFFFNYKSLQMGGKWQEITGSSGAGVAL